MSAAPAVAADPTGPPLGLLALAIQRFDDNPRSPAATLPAAPLRPVLARPRVWMPILGAALPAKLALAGFLFYLVPLALHAEGYGSSATGRALLLYFLLAAATNPVGAWLSDRFGWNRRLVIGGGLLIGAGGLAVRVLTRLTGLARLLRVHPIVRADGQLSIARSFVAAEWRIEGDQGRPRKYYALTREGAAELETMSDDWRDLAVRIGALIEKSKR